MASTNYPLRFEVHGISFTDSQTEYHFDADDPTTQKGVTVWAKLFSVQIKYNDNDYIVDIENIESYRALHSSCEFWEIQPIEMILKLEEIIILTMIRRNHQKHKNITVTKI